MRSSFRSVRISRSLFLLGFLSALLCACCTFTSRPSAAKPQTATYTDIVSGFDGKSRLLRVASQSVASIYHLQLIDDATNSQLSQVTISQPAGSGWIAISLAIDSSNNTYVLWSNSSVTADRSMMVWKMDSSLNYVSQQTFAPLSGDWRAADITTVNDAPCVLWSGHVYDAYGNQTYSTQAMLWVLDSSYNVINSPVYGPYADGRGYSRCAAAVGTSKSVRLLGSSGGNIYDFNILTLSASLSVQNYTYFTTSTTEDTYFAADIAVRNGSEKSFTSDDLSVVLTNTVEPTMTSKMLRLDGSCNILAANYHSFTVNNGFVVRTSLSPVYGDTAARLFIDAHAGTGGELTFWTPSWSLLSTTIYAP